MGESSVNRLIDSAEEEARKLTMALQVLRTDLKVAVLHYSPVEATVIDEPAARRTFLGNSLLEQAIDAGRATVAFHGHAHRGGADRAATPGGVPVFNVARPVLRRTESRVHVWEYRLPGFSNY